MRIYAIYALALLAASIASIIVAIGCALACYGAGFSVALTGSNILAISVAFTFAGFLLTFRQSYNYVLNQFDIYPDHATTEPEPQLDHKPDNVLLRHFDQAVIRYGSTPSPNEKIEFLSSEEIDNFKKHILTREEKEQTSLKKQLEKYELYSNNCCGISLEPIKDLKEPVTIEGVAHYRPWSKTYDKHAIRAWIESKGTQAREPQINCDLINPKNEIEIYNGFPKWFCEFIGFVRSILESRKTPVEKIDFDAPSRVLTLNHRNAFRAGYPTLFSTPVCDLTETTERNTKAQTLSVF